jgi:hypothetical protein
MGETQANLEDDLYSKIRRMILDHDKPFYLPEITSYFKNANIGNNKLVYDALNDLYDEGLIEHRFTENSCAFVVSSLITTNPSPH